MFWSPPSRPAVNTIFSSTLTWTLPIWAAGVVGVFTADVSFAFALMTSNQRERIGANSTKYLQQFYKSSIGFPAHWNSSQYNVMVICCSTWEFRTTILVKSNGTLGLFWQFHHSSPLPPYNVGSVCSKCPPWSNIVWVGGGRAKFGKKSCFYHRTGGDNENIANFQGVPYTFDQDWSIQVQMYVTVAHCILQIVSYECHITKKQQFIFLTQENLYSFNCGFFAIRAQCLQCLQP